MRQPRLFPGFTLIELMVSIGILSLLMVMVVQIANFTSNSWRHTRGNIEAFQESGAASEMIIRKLRQAVLNTYWDYDDFNAPTRYQRASELHFLAGRTDHPFLSGVFGSTLFPSQAIFFQAPLGFTSTDRYRNLDTLLNACGYYIEFGKDETRPSFVPTAGERWRYRLKEWQAPTEQLLLYTKTSGGAEYDSADWISLSPDNTRVLAENIIALIALPKLSNAEDTAGAALSPDFFYDSRTTDLADVRRHQLPPIVQLIMVAIDEQSAQRLADKYGTQPPPLIPAGLFRTSADLTSDLAALEDILNAKPHNLAGNQIRLNYVVINNEVSILGARWSAN